MKPKTVIFVLILYFSGTSCDCPDLSGCEVATKIEQGYVCGKLRIAADGKKYASFRGIPYAKQPLGELRFKELQPAEPFDGVFDATESGPICAQVDILYIPLGLAAAKLTGEDCIRINIHVPANYLPDHTAEVNTKPLLPILFWLHGGSFSYGSGDADVQGPEYLMTKDIIVVTINYRLHVFGFLSLNNEYIPGNNGLRDVITALRWVQKNIANFGGDCNRVTIGGQNAGGVMSHILSLSPAARGLFKQVIGLSGQAIASFYSYSPSYAKHVNTIFLINVGISPLLCAEELHKALVAVPLEKILHANKVLLDTFGMLSFGPVVETPQPNFTTVLSKSPEDLLNEGAGKEYPMIIGFCSNESAGFKKRLDQVNMQVKLILYPPLILPKNLLYEASLLTIPILTKMHLFKYFGIVFITLDNFLVSITDSYYMYPALRLAQKRFKVGASGTFVYQFGYAGKQSPIKLAAGDTWSGAAHIEDISYFFRFNHYLGPQEKNELEETCEDNRMKNRMTNYISNFVINGRPTENCGLWAETGFDLKFQSIDETCSNNFINLTPYMEDKLKYFTKLYKIGLGE